jgi:GTP-binding protein
MSELSSAKFLTGALRPTQFPPDEGAEIAFAGRSNAGKSSALNAVAGRNNLARTSKTPGRTQLINFFEVEPGRRLVDLPGYGYAKVSAQMQEQWRELLSAYITRRACLRGVVIVTDARRPLTDHDRQMIEWVQAQAAPCHVLLSKADKLSNNEAAAALKNVKAALGTHATAQLFSAVSKAGVVEARRQVLELLKKNPDGLGHRGQY